MLTIRGWWFFLTVLLVLIVSVWTNTPGVSVITLTLLLWFLGAWLMFHVRLLALQGRLRVVRQVADEKGSVQSLWVGRNFQVRVRLCSDAVLELPYVRIQERVPFGVKRLAGATHAEGFVSRQQPLEVSYHLHCEAPGQVRFEGLSVQIADLQGFFYAAQFVQAVRWYRVLPALADAKGRFPTAKRHNLLPFIGAHRHQRPGSGSELLDLRDYLPGDPPKMIAWKASARRDRLMTKEFESEVPIRCTLFMDTSVSVRIGLPGQNALARLVEIVAAVAQANSGARDLTGLCLFDEQGTSYVKPARSKRHVLEMYGMLADVANLAPTTGAAAVERLLPLAFGLAQEVYPHLLDADLNYYPWWLPLWAPKSADTVRRPPIRGQGLQPWLQRWFAYLKAVLYQNLAVRFNSQEWKWAAWRKQLSAILAVQQNLGPGACALLMEDDERFVLHVQHFLIEHQVPFELPVYGRNNEYLFAAPQKVEVLAGALRRAVGRGRDNELFVLLVDHHEIMVVCPWPLGVRPPDRNQREAGRREQKLNNALADLVRGRRSAEMLQWIVHHTTMRRLHHAFAEVRHVFARLGVPVLCARHDDSVQLILNRLERLRVLERGVR
jgi:uncharacterized protein (DUF58 family)